MYTQRTDAFMSSLLNGIHTAISGGALDVLDWLHTRTDVRNFISYAPCMSYAMNAAGNHGRVDSMQWLRAHGAQWPYDLFGGITGSVRRYWSLDALRFAFATGCEWAMVHWDCAKVRPLQGTAESRADAAAVLQWAHANGCPCTCPQA
jgi:hypothetical protein